MRKTHHAHVVLIVRTAKNLPVLRICAIAEAEREGLNFETTSDAMRSIRGRVMKLINGGIENRWLRFDDYGATSGGALVDGSVER